MILLSGPNLSGNELKYVTDCIETGWVSSVDPMLQFEKMISNHVGLNMQLLHQVELLHFIYRLLFQKLLKMIMLLFQMSHL